jgi:hypothetical protein
LAVVNAGVDAARRACQRRDVQFGDVLDVDYRPPVVAGADVVGGAGAVAWTPITDIPPNEVRLAWVATRRASLIAEFVELAQAAVRDA